MKSAIDDCQDRDVVMIEASLLIESKTCLLQIYNKQRDICQVILH
jgi:hypothetical protein